MDIGNLMRSVLILIPDRPKCDQLFPLYGINSDVMDIGDLRALNLCNLNLLEEQLKYLNSLYKMGITSYRYDQLNGIPPYIMQLYNNSNIDRLRK